MNQLGEESHRDELNAEDDEDHSKEQKGESHLLPLIQNKDVLSAAAAIAMNEESHLATLRGGLINLGGTVDGPQVPNGRAFGVAITPAQATAAVTSFIAK